MSSPASRSSLFRLSNRAYRTSKIITSTQRYRITLSNTNISIYLIYRLILPLLSTKRPRLRYIGSQRRLYRIRITQPRLLRLRRFTRLLRLTRRLRFLLFRRLLRLLLLRFLLLLLRRLLLSFRRTLRRR